MPPTDAIETIPPNDPHCADSVLSVASDLHRAVASVIAGKRIGKPVFVRYTLHGLEEPASIVPRLAQIAAVVRSWIGQPLVRLHSVGAAASGQVSLTLQFVTGATALVSFARAPRSGTDLMVLGNHGAIYHDAGSARLWDEPAGIDLPPAEPDLVQLIGKALSSGKPVSEGVGGRP